MDRNRRNFSNKRSNPQFKRKGGPGNGRKPNYVHEKSSKSSHVSETLYCILCQSKKIGSVLGKGGSRVKALREETQAKITVSESVPGLDERTIVIVSPSDKTPKIQDGNNGDQAEKVEDVMLPHCAAQDALLRVHDKIVEEDLSGADHNNEDDPVVTVRLLVSNNLVGCLLGKKGDVIQRLRSETGASIRVIPADHPAFSMSNDQLVQISGNPAIAKKALFEVSTLLHQNIRKDKPPPSFPTPYANHGFRPPGPPVRNMLPPRNPSWLEHDIHSMPPLPWKRGYGIHESEFRPEDFHGAPPPHVREAPSEFAMKIVCSAEIVGGLIGTEGLNVRQFELETGASIHIENVSPETNERIICVSSFEVLWDERSRTINAVLQLQSKTSEYSEKGTITTRLLVSSSKVGCILGQGGHIINDMRRRTHADIRVLSKEEKPKCASENEELVQISGSIGVAKDALAEISSRLRARCLRDSSSKGESVPVRPVPEFGPAGNLHGGGIHPSHAIRHGSAGRYENLRGGFHEYEPPSFPAPPHATSYLNVHVANMSSTTAMEGSHISEFAGTELKCQDPYSTGSDIGTSSHFNTSQDMYRPPITATGPPPNNYPPQQGPYHHHHPSYNPLEPQPQPHHQIYYPLELQPQPQQYTVYPNTNIPPSQVVSYQDFTPLQPPVVYENIYTPQQQQQQQGSYPHIIGGHGS